MKTLEVLQAENQDTRSVTGENRDTRSLTLKMAMQELLAKVITG